MVPPNHRLALSVAASAPPLQVRWSFSPDRCSSVAWHGIRRATDSFPALSHRGIRTERNCQKADEPAGEAYHNEPRDAEIEGPAEQAHDVERRNSRDRADEYEQLDRSAPRSRLGQDEAHSLGVPRDREAQHAASGEKEHGLRRHLPEGTEDDE